MKSFVQILTLLFFLQIASVSFSQNLVPNPSFELYDTCPTTLDQLHFATGWSSYSQTPDYFNICSPIGLAPPNASLGYQFPYAGNAYAGFLTMVPGDTNYREIVGAQLTSPLLMGTTYYFSFFINFAGIPDYTSLATSKTGLRFSTIPYSFTNPISINNFTHYYSTTVWNDTVNWVQLKGSFVADSIYQYIAIGNFFDDANMFPSDTIGMPSCNNWQAYYFIDQVAVSTDSTVAYITGTHMLDKHQYVSVYPNPCNNILHVTCDNIPKQIEVFDMFGSLRLHANTSLKKDEYILDMSSLNSGIYILKIDTKNQIIQKQIIIAH